MKVGYPCLGVNLGWKGTTTFRLASYTEDRLYEAVKYNLDSLQRTLEWNIEHGLYFFRVSSDIVPFASHPINKGHWQDWFGPRFAEIGEYARRHGMRLSTHPDQFVILNALDEKILHNSVAELAYHAAMFDLMGMDATHKIQIHVGGVYGDKPASIARFIGRHHTLPEPVKRRLVIENDDRLFHLDDCLQIHAATGIPVLFDWFHHQLNGNGRPLREAFGMAERTWQGGHGPMMVDYSSQAEGERVGKHCGSIDLDDFRLFLSETLDWDFDLMLEIKDKENSALQAAQAMRERGRLSAPVLA
jgi:UV DNA damage endonuclease